MSLKICYEIRHALVVNNDPVYPEAISFVRRDTCYEIEKVGGGIDLRTNGSKGLEIIASGRYTAEEKVSLLAFISNFASDAQAVIADGVNYGPMIMLEGTLKDEAGGVGGMFSIRLGGYEL